jgi:GT2 family glycosyltransferase
MTVLLDRAAERVATPAGGRAPGAPGERFISVVIPVRNGAATIGRCLTAAFASSYRRFEVVVVDDASEDGTAGIVAGFPCRLVRLARHGGVSRARNAGARASSGELLFFIDADCLMGKETLSLANARYGEGGDRVLGGTYTPTPADGDFFSRFQSVFVHHFETKRAEPDYVAAHAMLVDARTFERSGGFVEGSFLGVAASVEDVELCHRLRRSGCELLMDREIQVQHVFRFSLRRSLLNAARKARTWTRYSLLNRDLLADSGAASRELKANVLLGALQGLLLAGSAASGSAWPLAAALPLLAVNLLANRGLLAAWFGNGGLVFAALAALYYTTLYAAAVAVGGAAGAASFAWNARRPRGGP